MDNVLVVEDEDRMRLLIVAYLKKEGYDTFEACDGAEAIEIFSNNDIDIVILDVMMPLIDGFGVLKYIRKKSNVPVIMLTAKGEDDDKLQGLNFGADKYLTKPISPKVLMAEVNSIKKRSYEKKEPVKNQDRILEFGSIRIDLDSHTVKVNGEEVYFSLTEFKLLVYLMKNRGILLTREKIIASIWGMDYDGDERVVDTNIKRIRNKITEKNNYVNTIRGIGYRFENKAI